METVRSEEGVPASPAAPWRGRRVLPGSLSLGPVLSLPVLPYTQSHPPPETDRDVPFRPLTPLLAPALLLAAFAAKKEGCRLPDSPS